MAIQTKETYLQYTRAGQVMTQSKWEDVIDKLFDDDKARGKVVQISLSGYSGGGPYDFQKTGFAYNDYADFSVFNPLSIDDIVKYAGVEQAEGEYYAAGRNELTDGIILIVHNDGFFYGTGRGPAGGDQYTDLYISYQSRGGNEGYYFTVDNTTYDGNPYNDYPERQNLVVPVGSVVAFTWVRDGSFWTPIGNFLTITNEQLTILRNGGSIDESSNANTSSDIANIELGGYDAGNIAYSEDYSFVNNAYQQIPIEDIIRYYESRESTTVGDKVIITNIDWNTSYDSEDEGFVNVYVSCGEDIDNKTGITVIPRCNGVMFVKCSDGSWRPLGRTITITPEQLTAQANAN